VLGALAIALAVITTVFTVRAGKQVQQVTVQNTALQQTTHIDQTALNNQKKVQELISDGAQHSRIGEYAEAAKSYAAALSLDPKNVVALTDQGYLAYKQHDYSNAATLLQQAVNSDPTYPWGHYNLALALAAQGDTDGATAQIAALVKQSPKFKSTIQGDGQFKSLRQQPAVKALLAP
jgi:tetratricopeptide (TPR) repeat protein